MASLITTSLQYVVKCVNYPLNYKIKYGGLKTIQNYNGVSVVVIYS